MDADKETPKKPRRVGDGTPGPGRPKGSENKFTKNARDAFQFAFEECGGAERLAKWANDNYDEFLKLFARMIPLEVTGKDGKDLIPDGYGELEAARRMAFILELGARRAEATQH